MDDEYFYCVDYCSASQANKNVGYICEEMYGIAFAIPTVCTNMGDGKYAAIEDMDNYDMCDNACSETKGCI